MNKLLENILEIDEIISSVDKFVHIKTNIESLNTDGGSYKQLVNETNVLIEVLKAFGRRV